jgi:putative lipoprotein
MLIFEGHKNGYRFSSRVSRVKAPVTIAKTQHYLWQSLIIEINEQSLKLDFDGISYPIHTRNLKEVNKEDHTTGVVLFSQGTPKNWFPVKL